MKRHKIIYWTSTIIAMLTGAISAFFYLMGNPQITEGFVHLGFPAYFRIELGIAKIIGLLVILIPSIPVRIKDFAYAGFGIAFISAFIAHSAVGEI